MGEISKTEFASRANVVPSRISKWIEEGMPTTAKGKIDVAAAEKWMRDNLDHSRPQKGVSADPKLAEIRRARESVKLEADKIVLARNRGELIERSLVRRFLEARGRLDRDAHLGWCARVSALLASEFSIDSGRFHARLESLMRDHLRELAETPIAESEAVS